MFSLLPQQSTPNQTSTVPTSGVSKHILLGIKRDVTSLNVVKLEDSKENSEPEDSAANSSEFVPLPIPTVIIFIT